MSDYEDIRLSRPAESVLLIEFNRPERRNALRAQTIIELAAALGAAADDDGVRAVVLTGDDRAFAAGADIAEMVQSDGLVLVNDERMRDWSVVREFPKPLIAAVNGYAYGGGCEVAMHADIIIAGETAKFALPEVTLGVIPGAGGTQRLPRQVGKSLAMLMVLTGDPIDAGRALAAGLAAEVTPPEKTVERAVGIAARIATRAPLAARRVKDAVLKSYEMPLGAALEYERRVVADLFHSEDRTEGMNAFLEKRPPQFTGR